MKKGTLEAKIKLCDNKISLILSSIEKLKLRNKILREKKELLLRSDDNYESIKDEIKGNISKKSELVKRKTRIKSLNIKLKHALRYIKKKKMC